MRARWPSEEIEEVAIAWCVVFEVSPRDVPALQRLALAAPAAFLKAANDMIEAGLDHAFPALALACRMSISFGSRLEVIHGPFVHASRGGRAGAVLTRSA